MKHLIAILPRVCSLGLAVVFAVQAGSFRLQLGKINFKFTPNFARQYFPTLTETFYIRKWERAKNYYFILAY